MTAYHTFFFNLIPFANKLLHLQQQQQQQEQYLSCMSIIDLDHLKVIRLFQLQCPVICLNLFDFTQFQGWLEWLGHFQFTRHTHTHTHSDLCVRVDKKWIDVEIRLCHLMRDFQESEYSSKGKMFISCLLIVSPAFA